MYKIWDKAQNEMIEDVEDKSEYKADRYIVMEDTGLVGDNGNKVYRYDVVEVENGMFDSTVHLVRRESEVESEWTDGEWQGVICQEGLTPFWMYDEDSIDLDESVNMKVIGNRFETPELVKDVTVMADPDRDINADRNRNGVL